MKRTLPLLALLAIATLIGCNNDSNDPTPEPQVQQKGHGEVEIYDAARRPDGHIVQPGETAVLALEAINSAANPDPGDTSNAGIDEVTFDVKDPGPLTLALTEAELAVITKAELWTLTGGLLAQVDRQTPSRTVSLTAGRYLLRIHASHTQETPVSLFVYPTVATPSQTNAQLRYDPAQVQQLLQTNICPGCDLSGADLIWANLTRAILGGANLSGANLSGANLSLANLSLASLPGAELTKAILLEADLTRATLTQANLTGAAMNQAILRDADLLEANLTGANLTQANLTDTILNGATWTNGGTCAYGSIGQCN